ncbi:MAG: hypothetical protein IJW44_02720 [Clostridia bacterium]|nr:hypothetical protein [Clostridia bacterium]
MNNTTNKPRKFALLYTVIGLLCAVIAIALRTVNFFFFFDAEIGYHQANALLPILANVQLALAVVFFAVAAFLWFRKTNIGYPKELSAAIRIAALPAAAGFLFRAIFVYLNRAEGDKLALLSLLTGIAGAGYFLLLAFNQKQESFRILSGFCAIVHLILTLASSYFNIFIQMNAPDKLMLQLGCLGGMLFLINELRAWISRPRPALYMFSTTCAALLLGVASIPSIVAYHAGILTDRVMMAGYYLLLGLFLYVTVRLIVLSLRPEAPEEEAEEIIEAEDEPNEVPVEEADEPQEEAVSQDTPPVAEEETAPSSQEEEPETPEEPTPEETP